ncbi:MAG: chemotaxis protein CheD [Capsulimonadaceae bacterium]|nr:chemotaxis protein CheD [Capsulimonadaceae bacterium]
MNHYLLPYGPSGSPSDCRYGEYAIPLLIQRCIAKGASPERLIAKIFGGASMQTPSGDAAQRVGELNIGFAVEELTDRAIPIAGQDVGGRFARDIRFDTQTGGVRVKRILIGASLAVKR